MAGNRNEICKNKTENAKTKKFLTVLWQHQRRKKWIKSAGTNIYRPTIVFFLFCAFRLGTLLDCNKTEFNLLLQLFQLVCTAIIVTFV